MDLYSKLKYISFNKMLTNCLSTNMLYNIYISTMSGSRFEMGLINSLISQKSYNNEVHQC